MGALREAVDDLEDPVAADLLENEEAYLLVIDLPGATPECTSISTTDGRLTVRADRDRGLPSDAEPIQIERPQVLAFELPLPADADATSARASLADGLLEVTIPRDTTDVTIPIERG